MSVSDSRLPIPIITYSIMVHADLGAISIAMKAATSTALNLTKLSLSSNGTLGDSPHQPTGVEGECYLLADTFGYAMQLLLFVFSMGSLLLKWYLEVPRRQFTVFAADMSKQCFAGGWYHILNVCLSMALENAKSQYGADECAWYWTQFMIDCTVGLWLNWVILRGTEKFFGYESGRYLSDFEGNTKVDATGDPMQAVSVDYQEWLKQGLVFCFIVTCSKFLIVAALLVDGVASMFGIWGTMWIEDPQMRLIFVMVITPVVMNTMAFWVTDEFIRYEPKLAQDAKVVAKVKTYKGKSP